MRTADFDFNVPPELIAQCPAAEREGSRLLVVERGTGQFQHRVFNELPQLIQPGDVLVINNSRVIPARLRGRNGRTGGGFEILLLEQNAPNDWWVMLRPGKRARVGTEILLERGRGEWSDVKAVVTDTNEEGHRRVTFHNTPEILQTIEEIGEVPLPPYIERNEAGPDAEDRRRYQTVYAERPGSVAAPTAGLHFSDKLLAQIRERGAMITPVTLHVGLGTFAPVKSERIAGHTMHEERFDVPEETARVVNAAKRDGRRVIATGTTTVRVLETVAGRNDGMIVAGRGATSAFIFPPYEFRVADALLTNFHLPRSTLLMLVSAFAEPGGTAGRELVLRAYGEAVRLRYRFFSYGDAMLLV